MIDFSLREILFKKDLKEYISMDHETCSVNDFKVYTIINNSTYELNGKENVICLNPLQLCIIDTPILPDKITVIYSYKKYITAIVECSKRKIATLTSETQIYYIKGSNFKRYSFLQLLIYYYKINFGKKKYSFRKYLDLASTFFYPRKVILVSVSCQDFVSIFPMDFVLHNATKNQVVLGLRTTNKTNDFIGNKNLKISIANFEEKNKNDAYDFGKFHSRAFPNPKEMPYEFIETEMHHNLFPNFIKNYQELELISCTCLGEQNMLICKIVYSNVININENNSLYHLHYLSV